MLRNVAAGSLSGALAAWASNPIDLIKTRLQSKENPHRTSSAVVRSIVQADGVRGLWRGTVPSTVSTNSKPRDVEPQPTSLVCCSTGSLRRQYLALGGANLLPAMVPSQSGHMMRFHVPTCADQSPGGWFADRCSSLCARQASLSLFFHA